MSHPVWVRGLKQPEFADLGQQPTSHPVWVRGLKLLLHYANWKKD